MICLIVDDEPAARALLQEYAHQAGGLEIAASCSDALQARQVLNENHIDLLFLDINMPKISGIDFLKTLANPPQVILTTAFSEYALDGYELHVADYLLKPFSFERFLKALDKVKPRLSSQKIITVKADGRFYRIPLNSILFAESNGDYLTLHTIDKKLTFYQTLQDFYARLPDGEFCRVHKSFIVALSKIDYLSRNVIKIGNHEIPVGKAFRNDFLSRYLKQGF